MTRLMTWIAIGGVGSLLASCKGDHDPARKEIAMKALPVPIVLIDEQQKDAYLEAGYNPPGSDLSRDDFLAERDMAFDAVKAAMARHWKHPYELDGSGGLLAQHSPEAIQSFMERTEEGDFFMSYEHLGSARFLCIEVSNEDVISRETLALVHEVVVGLEADYSVDICDAWFVMRDREGNLHPHFNIFVEKHRILVFTESDVILQKLGIDRENEKEENE